jgi:hypothetical protein
VWQHCLHNQSRMEASAAAMSGKSGMVCDVAIENSFPPSSREAI